MVEVVGLDGNDLMLAATRQAEIMCQSVMAGNWYLAGHAHRAMTKKLKEFAGRKAEGSKVAGMVAEFSAGVGQELAKSIEAENRKDFLVALEAMVKIVNQSHAAAKFPFIRLRMPTIDNPSMLDFNPA